MLAKPQPVSASISVVRVGQAATALVYACLALGCAGGPRSGSTEPLRIGTSGDHPPYSQLVSDRYIGIDIDLARDLARTLGREPVFVRFRWPTLVADIVEGRFDIALSGIAITSSRGAVGTFSQPYLTVGHQAVIRCHDAARFSQLADVNRTGIQVLVTRGTTESDFAAERLPNATVLAIDDGPTLFSRLSAGEGDITFANTLRALYAVRRDPVLCSGFDGVAFGETEVAAYMPQSSPYKALVDPWLVRRTQDGFVARLVEAHVEPR